MEKRQSKIYINIKISIIIIFVIMIISTSFIKNNENELTKIAKVEFNQAEDELSNIQVTSRYDIDRIQDEEELAEYVEISSDDLLNEYIEYSHVKSQDVNFDIENVSISRNMDITVRTGLSKENFKKLVSNVRADTSGFFYDNADLIYDLCEKYDLNEIFFCGLISAESGWEIVSYHRSTYNYISLMSNGKLIQFNSVEDGLESAARTLHNNYLSEGGCFYYGNTLSAMQTRFCPGSSTWVNLVYGRMEQML